MSEPRRAVSDPSRRREFGTIRRISHDGISQAARRSLASVSRCPHSVRRSLTPHWSQRRLLLESMDGFSYHATIELAQPLAPSARLSIGSRDPCRVSSRCKPLILAVAMLALALIGICWWQCTSPFSLSDAFGPHHVDAAFMTRSAAVTISHSNFDSNTDAASWRAARSTDDI